MSSPFREILIGLVVVFGVFWLVTSTKIVQVKKRESATSSLSHSVLLIAGFLVVFLDRFQFGILAFRFIPEYFAIKIIGVIIAALAVGFAIGARIILGANWSSKVSINEGQQLIKCGPYAVVRNPIYTGVIFFMLGTALVSGEVCGIIGIGLVVISVWQKAKVEERFLLDEFGDEYRDYQKRVKFIIPFIV